MDKFFCFIKDTSPFMPNEKGYTRSLTPNKQGYYMFYSKKRAILIPKDYIIFEKEGERNA